MQRLDSLTGMRFIAAAMIVLHHIQGMIWNVPISGLKLTTGVSFFFCLSGFVLHYGMRRAPDKVGTWRFIFLRVVRLWPAHLAALAWYLIVFSSVDMWGWLTANLSITQLLSVVFLVQSWVPNSDYYFAWNAPSWSISTELAFYMAFPLLCRGLVARPLATTAAVFAVIALYLLVAAIWFYDPTVPGNLVGLIYINPIARFGEFALGALTCELMARRKWSLTDVSVTTFEAAFMSAAALGVWQASSLAAPFYARLHPLLAIWFDSFLLAPVLCGLVAVLSLQQGLLSKALSTPAMVWLGNISFAMYLVHQPIVNGFARFGTGNPLTEIPAFVAWTLGVSAVIYYLVEMPCMRAGKWLVSKTRSPAHPKGVVA